MAKLKPYFKVGKLMLTGKPVTVEEIDTLLGEEITMSKLSMYIWEIKNYATRGVVKVQKDGKKVVSYQLINPETAKPVIEAEFKRVEAANQKKKSKSIKKLSDLQSTQIDTEVAQSTEELAKTE
jgi:hypothetical protein